MRRRLIVCLCLASVLAGASAFANTFQATGSFPGDTRRAATMPGAPWRCIGRLSLPNHRFMTASLVGPDLILTAAHGLVRDGQLKPGSFIFRPDYGHPPHATVDSATVTRCWLGSYAPNLEPNVHADWAILQLDRKLGDAYGTLAVDDVNAATLAVNRRPLCLVSYNRDFRYGRVPSWQAGCSFVALNPTGYLLHDFSTDNGASGAPIFYFTNWSLAASAHILALNVAEKTTHGDTFHRVPFALRVANVAVAAREFYPTLQRLLAGDLSNGQPMR
jgi:V8-like Glu-specific endopeptidase